MSCTAAQAREALLTLRLQAAPALFRLGPMGTKVAAQWFQTSLDDLADKAPAGSKVLAASTSAGSSMGIRSQGSRSRRPRNRCGNADGGRHRLRS